MVTATFLTEDSYLGSQTEPLTLNRYNYCVSSYLNYTDPSGNEVEVLESLKGWIIDPDTQAQKTIENYENQRLSLEDAIESGLLNNRAGQIFLDYGDVIMGPPVTLPSSLVGIREAIKGNSDSEEMQRTATAGFYAGFVGQGLEYVQIISKADYQLSLLIVTQKGLNAAANPLTYVEYFRNFSPQEKLEAAKRTAKGAWNGEYDSALGRKTGAATLDYLLVAIGGALMKGESASCEVAESGSYSGTGEYGDVGGHHVHAKAGFKDDVNYDPKKGFSISQNFMRDNGLDHNIMTSKQRELFKELYESGRPNTLEEHTRIAREALKAGGASDSMIDDLINASLRNLREQGVTAPTRIHLVFKINIRRNVRMDNYLEEFGKIFIKEVRDRTIDVFDRKTQGLMKSKESQLLFERVNKLNDEQKSLISDIIPQIVDLSIHNMLCLFEEHDEFQIIVGGENIADISDGLSGELYTSDG